MEYQIIDDSLNIKLIEKIDSTNFDSFSIDLFSIINKNPDLNIVLDLEATKYISSAGLRIILSGIKSNKNISIINADLNLYEIFKKIGFTEMIDISKAYINISSVDLEINEETNNLIIYRLNDDTLLKVIKNNNSLKEINAERNLARKALILGVNTAISYDIYKVDDKYGSLYEFNNSKSIAKWINMDNENIDKYIKLYVDFLKEIHATAVIDDALPIKKEIQIKKIEYLKEFLDTEYYNKLSQVIANIPDANNLIHCNYDPCCVYYDGNEITLIDMSSISKGNDIFDFVSIYSELVSNYLFKCNCYNAMKQETSKYFFEKAFDLYYGKECYEEKIKIIKTLSYSSILIRLLRNNVENKDLIEEAKSLLIKTLDEIY